MGVLYNKLWRLLEERGMILTAVSIICTIVYGIILHLNIYTDHAMLPGNEMRTWHRSPIGSLYTAGRQEFLYPFLDFVAVSVVTGLMVIFGMKFRIIRLIQLVSTIAATVMFIIIMIVAGNIHPKY